MRQPIRSSFCVAATKKSSNDKVMLILLFLKQSSMHLDKIRLPVWALLLNAKQDGRTQDTKETTLFSLWVELELLTRSNAVAGTVFMAFELASDCATPRHVDGPDLHPSLEELPASHLVDVLTDMYSLFVSPLRACGIALLVFEAL
jgi:hypothetical protein